MKKTYEIKGITLDLSEMAEISRFYEAYCTAEYMLATYEQVTEENAMELGYEVRRLMCKFDYSEDEAISEVLDQLCDDEEDEED